MVKIKKAGSKSKLKTEKLNSCSKLQTKTFKKDINRETKRKIRVLIYIVRNNVLKVKGKHLIFETSIVRVKTYLLINNKYKAKLIDAYFVRANKISSFELEKSINFIFKNGKII